MNTLPIALDTERLPLTLHVPNQITHPPRASILFFSSCNKPSVQSVTSQLQFCTDGFTAALFLPVVSVNCSNWMGGSTIEYRKKSKVVLKLTKKSPSKTFYLQHLSIKKGQRSYDGILVK